MKQLLKRLLIPRAPLTTKGETVVEEQRTEQQAAKTTTCGKGASGRLTNSQQVPCLQVEYTHSAAPNSKKAYTEAGPSKPHNRTVSGLPPRSIVS